MLKFSGPSEAKERMRVASVSHRCADAGGRSNHRLWRSSWAGVFWALLILTGFCCHAAFAQVFSASITGRVTDPSGAVIPGAKVTATNVANGFTYPTMTNSAGLYTLQSLPPGAYKLSVDAQGFRTAIRTGVALVVSQHATEDITMTVGATTQAVTVTGVAPLLQAQDATTGQTVGRQLINDLPLIGRTVTDLAFLTPGVNPAPGRSFKTPQLANNFVSNGGRNATADVLLDGVSVSAPEQNTQILDPLYIPSVDAVEEFKVEQNNFSADKGFSGNTIVDVVLRSGTNQFHGTAYEFFQNTALNANNWFNNRAGLSPAASRNNDFGGTLGGPIQKNKMFFFVDYEGDRSASADSFDAGVPSAAERAGDFSELCGENGGTFSAAGKCSAASGQLWDPYTGVFNSKTGQNNLTQIIPFNNMAAYVSPGNPALNGTPFQLPATAGNLINPVALKMMQYFPMPNLNVGNPAYNHFDNWAGTGSDTGRNDQFDIKVDRQISDRTHIDARYSKDLSDSDSANAFGNALDPNAIGPNSTGIDSAVLNVNHNFSPTLLLSASYGYTRNINWIGGIGANYPNFDYIKTLGLPAYMTESGFNLPPTIDFGSGYSSVSQDNLGYQTFSILHYALETHDLLASLDKMSGRHEFKFGGQVRVYKDDFEQPGYPSGDFTFSQFGTSQTPKSGTGGDALASLLTGVGGSGQYEIPLAIATQNFEYAAYFQDNWHATGKLTLNLGIRYALYMPATERHNKQEWFDPTAVNPLSSQNLSLSPAAAANFSNAGLPVPNLTTLLGGHQFTSASQRTPIDPTYKNISPRFGLAYRITPNTVLRGGYGIFYGTPDYTAHGTGLGANDGFLQRTSWLGTYQGSCCVPGPSLSNPFPPANFSTAPPGGLILPPGSSEGLLTDIGLGLTGYIRSWNQVPYSQTWNFGAQHQFGSVLVDAEYVGTKGTHLYMGRAGNLNYLGSQVESYTPAQIQALTNFVPNPFFGVITTPGCSICGSTVRASQLAVQFPEFNGVSGTNPPWGNSEYNALQLRVEKRFSHGLEVLANYTWSKSLDDSSAAGSNVTWLGGSAPTPQDPNNRRLEYALSQYDIPQVLTFAYVYQLPIGRGKHWGGGWNRWEDAVLGGWQTQGVFRFDDGQPLGLSSNSSTPLPTYGSQRPNLTGTLRVNNCDETCRVNGYFANPQVAETPPIHTLGTAARVINVYAPNWERRAIWSSV